MIILQPGKFSDFFDKSRNLLPACCLKGCGNGFTHHRKEEEKEKKTKKKPNFLLVYYLSDSEMGYNYGVTFPTANMFQCKQLTAAVPLAGLRRLLGDYGKLQCPMNNK